MGLGRFLNKRMVVGDGFQTSSDDDRAALFEGDTYVVTRPTNIEGLVTATMGIVGSMTTGPLKVLGNVTATAVTFNAGVVGSMTITKALVGDIAGTAVTFNAGTIGSMTITKALVGDITGTAVAFNAGTIGSMTVTKLIANELKVSAAGAAVSAMYGITYTWNVPALAGVVGSLSGIGIADVAMSGAAIGDTVQMYPLASIHQDIVYQAMCMTAGAVTVKARYIGSTGAVTPGNTPFRITAIRI